MQMNNTFNEANILSEVDTFINSFKSVVIGTKSINNEIDVTYAPHTIFNGEHYIYISEIGDHFTNLKDNPQEFEILFLQDENEAMSPILRKRARFNVTCEFLPRDEKFDTVLDAFEETVGEGMKIVRKMQDFHLVKLNILNGRFVKGFGQAYLLSNGRASQITGDRKTHMPSK